MFQFFISPFLTLSGCLELQDGTGHLLLQAGGCLVGQAYKVPPAGWICECPTLSRVRWIVMAN